MSAARRAPGLPEPVRRSLEALQPARWRARAACAVQGIDPELFFPPQEDSAGAAEVCVSCPVRVACLAEALLAGERHGVWGGLTPPQRRHVRALLIARSTPRAAGQVRRVAS